MNWGVHALPALNPCALTTLPLPSLRKILVVVGRVVVVWIMVVVVMVIGVEMGVIR